MSLEQTSRRQSGLLKWPARANASGVWLRVVAFCSLLLFTFWESTVISQGAGSEVVFLSLPLPGMSVLMLALACGVCVGGTLDALLYKSTLHASAHPPAYQFLPSFFAFCAAILLLTAPLFYDASEYARATAAVFAGAQLPRLLTLLAACAPIRIQAIIFACAHALAEVLAFTMSSQDTGIMSNVLYNSDLLLGIVIGGLGILLLSVRSVHDVSPVRTMGITAASPDMPQNQSMQMTATLIGAALLFFLLHATHDYAFRLYSLLNEGPPVWMKLGLRLTFPVLALIVTAWGLMPLAAVSLAMSALAPALEIFPGNTSSYWGVFAIDTIGLHGGLFFFILAFSRVARQNPFAGLLRSIPFCCMYITFGSMGIFNENIEGNPLYMLVASLVILGVQAALMLCMQSQWGSILCLNDRISTSAETSVETIEVPPGPHSDAAVEAFALAHCISPRETQVLHLVCEGLSYAQIAERLFIAENTIKIHVSRILKKTTSKSRSQLVCKIFDPQRQVSFND